MYLHAFLNGCFFHVFSLKQKNFAHIEFEELTIEQFHDNTFSIKYRTLH